jgi:MFS family permease
VRPVASGEDLTAASGWRQIGSDLRVSGTALAATFRSRRLGPMQLAFTAFNLAEWGGFIALFVFAYQFGGTAAVGIAALAQQIPAALVAPFGAALGDRYDRRRVLIAVMLALTIATLAAGAAMILDAPAWLAFLFACAGGWILTLVRPTYKALLPWVVTSPQELTTSYAASGLIVSMSTFLGPLLVGIALSVAGANGVSGPGVAYVVLGVLLLFGTIASTRTRQTNQRSDPVADEHFHRGDLLAGFGYVFHDERRRILVWLVGSSMLLLGMIDAVVVVLAIDVLGTGEGGVGFLNAAVGVGAVVGAMVAMIAGQRARLFPSFRAGLLAAGVPLAATAAVPALAAPLLAVSGSGMILLDVTGTTMLQRIVPDDKLARVFGVLESLYVGMEGIGAFVASLLLAWIGPEWTLVIASVYLPASGFIVRRKLASLDVGVRVPTEEMARLRATDLFAPLPPQALERVARDLVPVDAPAGSVVIRQGDPGSRFYVLVEGRAVVTRDGAKVTDRGPGDYFGEVALLLDQPRNATVTAVTDLRLFVLERDEFLRVVTGNAGVGMRARSVADERAVIDPHDD